MTCADPAVASLAVITRLDSVDLRLSQLLGGTRRWGDNDLVDAILAEPAVPGGLLHFTNAGASSCPFATFSFPPVLVLSLSGLTIDAMVMLMTNTGVVVEQSNVARATLQ